jgi:DNA-binding winged helix-turn-helix (wHTH) protein
MRRRSEVQPAKTYRFGDCELDEAGRTLSAHGRDLKLQPLVFDLICYLVRNRDRVVAKDELLDALWPGTVVVDNALQRAVSLARSALARVGMSDTIRTYSRHGYRFCIEQDAAAGADTSPGVAAPKPAPGEPPRDLEFEGRAAYVRGDWAAACEAFKAAEAGAPLGADDVELWGRAAICAGLGPDVVGTLGRAVAERDLVGDTLGAVRLTLLLVQINIDQTQWMIARGLMQRAARQLEGREDHVERGQYAWLASRLALADGQSRAALAYAEEAISIGRQRRDADLECLGMVYRGHALMALGKLDDGAAQHEEVAALIGLGDVRSWVVGWVLCSLMYAARNRSDWLRARFFAEAFEEWSRSSRMRSFPGTCQIHRAAVLHVQGQLDEALVAARDAAEHLARIAPWAEGDAYCVLGEIQLERGDFETAEASFRKAHALGWDPQPGLARLHLLTGRSEVARRALERALGDPGWVMRERRAELLCLLVHAQLATGDIEKARETLRSLSADPELVSTEALRAQHAVAQAEIEVVDGAYAEAVRCLRKAIRHWREIDSRRGSYATRLRLAECLLLDGDAHAAELELHSLSSQPTVLAADGARLALLKSRLATPLQSMGS